jgi:hypothetical protein
MENWNYVTKCAGQKDHGNVRGYSVQAAAVKHIFRIDEIQVIQLQEMRCMICCASEMTALVVPYCSFSTECLVVKTNPGS